MINIETQEYRTQALYGGFRERTTGVDQLVEETQYRHAEGTFEQMRERIETLEKLVGRLAAAVTQDNADLLGDILGTTVELVKQPGCDHDWQANVPCDLVDTCSKCGEQRA